MIDIYRLFQESDTEELIAAIKDRIYTFDLSKKNRDGYLALRQQYNETGDPLDLFVLRCYSFNNQLRFNRKHEFNVPFGANRSHFNSRTEENLRGFCEAMHKKNIVLSSVDFRDFDYSVMSRGDLIYCDPPYLISDAPYHDGKNVFKDWTEDEQAALLALLDWLDSRGIFFALSNVFIHKGMRNDRLIKWSQKYHVTYIDKSYSNCSYHLKDRTAQTVEVLVTNY